MKEFVTYSEHRTLPNGHTVVATVKGPANLSPALRAVLAAKLNAALDNVTPPDVPGGETEIGL